MKMTFFLKVLLFYLVLNLNSLGVFASEIFFDKSHDGKELSLDLAGGKATNLFYLSKIEGVNVPDWFVLSSDVYKDLVLASVQNEIKKLQKLSDQWNDSKENRVSIENEIFEITKTVRTKIENLPIPKHIKDQIDLKFDQLTQKSSLGVAVRSSATMEDLKSSSFAGLYDSYLFQKKEKLIFAMKGVWASVFNDRAVMHRVENKIRHENVKIAVVFQNMIDADSSGTAFNIEFSTGYRGTHISSNYGLGESIVQGDIESDEFLVNKRNVIIKKVLGSKNKKSVFSKAVLGTDLVDTTKKERSSFSLTNQNILSIHQGIELIHNKMSKIYNSDLIDTEFAIFNNQVYFVQVRPAVILEAKEINVVKEEDIKRSRVITRGKYSVPGAIHGRLRIVEDFKDLEDRKVILEKDDILLTHRTANYWTQYLTNVKGLVTIEGTPTSHPILLARERGMPCVIGLKGKLEDLLPFDNKEVTLDGYNRIVLEGRIPISPMPLEEVNTQLKVVEVEQLLSDEDSKRDLLGMKRGFEDQDGFWVANPNYVLSQIIREMQTKGYDERLKLINMARKNPVKSSLDTKIKEVDGKIYDLWVPLEKNIELFSGMDIEECEAFYKNYEEKVEEFLSLSRNFKLTAENFRAYTDIFTDLSSYMWLSFFFRTYVNQKASQLAHDNKIPVYYFEKISQFHHGNTFEEDVGFRDEKVRLKELLLQKFGIEEIVKSLTVKTIEQEAPEIYDQLKSFTRMYKFSKSSNLSEELPIGIALKTITGLSQEDIAEYHSNKLVEDMDITYCDNRKEISRWIKLSVVSRIQQCNTHHRRLRGQWPIRDELIKFGELLVQKGSFKTKEEIFNLSINEVLELLE